MGHESHESHSFTSPCPCGAAGLVKKRGILAAPEHPFSLLLADEALERMPRVASVERKIEIPGDGLLVEAGVDEGLPELILAVLLDEFDCDGPGPQELSHCDLESRLGRTARQRQNGEQ